MPRKRTPDQPQPAKRGAVITGGAQLDYAAAAKKLAKGATTRNIAIAAGSKAKTTKDLSAVGRRIVQVLKTRGEIFETFNKLGYDVERFARQVIDQTDAQKVTRTHHLGELTAEYTDIDWAARQGAREQYMRAVGITDLDPVGGDAGGGILDIDDAALAAALEEIAAADAARPAGKRGPTTPGAEPAQVDTAAQRSHRAAHPHPKTT